MTAQRRQSARSRRHELAIKMLGEARESRKAAGLPDITWREDPMMVFFLPMAIFAIIGCVVLVFTTVLPLPVAIGIRIAVIVLIGAAGLVLRGLGELNTSPKQKAIGYFLGAAAYAATAVVALVNGVRIFIAS